MHPNIYFPSSWLDTSLLAVLIVSLTFAIKNLLESGKQKKRIPAKIIFVILFIAIIVWYLFSVLGWWMIIGLGIILLLVILKPWKWNWTMPIKSGFKFSETILWIVGATAFVLLYIFLIGPFFENRVHKKAMEQAKQDNDLRMNLGIQTGTTSVESLMIPHGPFTSDYNLEEGTRVTWGSLSGSFYPIEIGKTIMVELASCTDPSKHCQIRAQRISAGRAKVNIHLDTAREPDGTYKDGLYTIKWISDKQAFVYSPTPIVLDENNEMYIAHN